MKILAYGVLFFCAALWLDGYSYRNPQTNKSTAAVASTQNTASTESHSAPKPFWAETSSNKATAEPVAYNPGNLPSLPTDAEAKVQAANAAVAEAKKVDQMMVFIDNRAANIAAQKLAYAEYEYNMHELSNQGVSND